LDKELFGKSFQVVLENQPLDQKPVCQEKLPKKFCKNLSWHTASFFVFDAKNKFSKCPCFSLKKFHKTLSIIYKMRKNVKTK